MYNFGMKFQKIFLFLILFFLGVMVGYFFLREKEFNLYFKKLPRETNLEYKNNLNMTDSKNEEGKYIDKVIDDIDSLKYVLKDENRMELTSMLMDFLKKYSQINNEDYKYKNWSNDLINYLNTAAYLKVIDKGEKTRIFYLILFKAIDTNDVIEIDKFIESSDYFNYLDDTDKNRLKDEIKITILQQIDIFHRNTLLNMENADGTKASLKNQTNWNSVLEARFQKKYLKLAGEVGQKQIINFVKDYIKKFQ